MQKPNLNFSLPPEHEPPNVLEQFEKESKSIAKQSLKIGVQDVLEMTKYLAQPDVTAIDNILTSENAPTLSDVRSIFWAQIPKIFRRNKINNIEEYYLMKELLVDVDSKITSKQRIKLNSMLNDFEARQMLSK